jgi:ATP-dependent DNA helicase RecQ
LQLFALRNSPNPHIKAPNGDFVNLRKAIPFHKTPKLIPRYELLGMKDLFIDFAGFKQDNHPTCKAIKELKMGNCLTLSEDNTSLYLLNDADVPVARLSKKAQKKWKPHLAGIKKITVIALARRYKADIRDPKYQKRCWHDSWEVPIVELTFTS